MISLQKISQQLSWIDILTKKHRGVGPRYNGYSVGHWEDDYNLVVDTTGLDERTWATNARYGELQVDSEPGT